MRITEWTLLLYLHSVQMMWLFQFEAHPVVLYKYDLDPDLKDNQQITTKSLFILHDLVQKQQQHTGRHPVIVQCL